MESAILNNKKIYAFELNESKEGLLCSCCKQEVIFKKGTVKRPHFAHKNKYACTLSENESEEHRHIKTEIYKSLKNYYFIENLEMEKFLKNCIADIYFEKGNKKYAIEIQLSNLTRGKIEERTKKYTDKGIYVIWVQSYNQFLERINLSNKDITLKDWEKWLIAMNYGHLYLWKSNDNLIPVTFKRNSYHKKNERTITSKEKRSIAQNFFGIKKERWNDFPYAKILYFK